MNSKTYLLPNGKTAVFEYDACGIGKITLECLDELMSMIADRPQKVIAQITFDEEKLREIVKETVERFKEEYEIIDRPQGEWTSRNPYWHTAICSNCNKVTMFEEWDGEVIEYDYCPNCGARMEGADDDQRADVHKPEDI